MTWSSCFFVIYGRKWRIFDCDTRRYLVTSLWAQGNGDFPQFHFTFYGLNNELIVKVIMSYSPNYERLKELLSSLLSESVDVQYRNDRKCPAID